MLSTIRRTQIGVSFKVLDTVLNVFGALGLLLMVVVLIGRYSRPRGGTDQAPTTVLQSGSKLASLATSREKNGFTLIMALSAGCHWCSESAPFYRELVSSPSKAFHMMAVLPQPVAEGKAYLRALGLSIADVRQVDFGKFGVSATPTLVIVNSSGNIQASWVGKLSPLQEEEVLRQVGIPRAAGVSVGSLPSHLLTGKDLLHLLDAGVAIRVVDVRPRELYRIGHLALALNIPIDELEVRALHEVGTDSLAVVYCRFRPQCESSARAGGLSTVCSDGENFLRQLGFSRVGLLSEDLLHLKEAGLGVTGVTSEGSTPVR